MSYSMLLSLGSIDLKMSRSGKPYHFPLNLNEDLYLLKVISHTKLLDKSSEADVLNIYIYKENRCLEEG